MTDITLNTMSIVELKDLANEVSAELKARREQLKLARAEKSTAKEQAKVERAENAKKKAEAKALKMKATEERLAKAKAAAVARLERQAKLDAAKKAVTNVTPATLKKMGAATGKVVANRR